jgi:hypothetical protein
MVCFRYVSVNTLHKGDDDVDDDDNNNKMDEPEKIPDWLVTGITYLLPKSGDSKAVRNYQAIIYLTTMYKTLTRTIATRISTHLEEQDILPAEQKGCQPGSKGCKDQLMISKAIYEDCNRRKKHLSIAWIDYQKAFDSIPHSWVQKSMDLVGTSNKIVRFFKLSMEKWNTMLHLKTKQEVVQSRPIQIRRGIFQGDSRSPLLFCITLIPLTHELNRADCGYQVHGAERKINDLLYRDDLKLLSRSEEELKNKIHIVKATSKDINMNFGFENAKICLKRGRVQKKTYIESTFAKDIKELDPRKACKYLGTEDSHDVKHKNEKQKLKKEYLRRLRLVLDTELSAKNKIQATGALAVPVIRYTLEFINWHQEEL